MVEHKAQNKHSPESSLILSHSIGQSKLGIVYTEWQLFFRISDGSLYQLY